MTTLEIILFAVGIYTVGFLTGWVGMGLSLVRELNKEADEVAKHIVKEMEKQVEGDEWKASEKDDDNWLRKQLGE